MNPQIIAVVNQKGGTGKSTTCANLGIGLAKEGKRVLITDNDPQGSLTISLGWTQPDALSATLTDAMSSVILDTPTDVSNAVSTCCAYHDALVRHDLHEQERRREALQGEFDTEEI